MKVKELKEWLTKCEDNDNIIIDYQCNDDWYNYYGSDITVDFDGDNIVLCIIN